jgi:hypothetical protein
MASARLTIFFLRAFAAFGPDFFADFVSLRLAFFALPGLWGLQRRLKHLRAPVLRAVQRFHDEATARVASLTYYSPRELRMAGVAELERNGK